MGQTNDSFKGPVYNCLCVTDRT